MEIKLGFNTLQQKTYKHTPDAEKEMFKDLISYYIDSNKKLQAIKGIEIGVLYGETSGFLLSVDSKINLLGIDPLIPDSMESSLIGSLDLIKSNTKPAEERYIFIHDYSYNVAKEVKENDIDFIFIDGDHTYEAVQKDFEDYFPKVKSGGLIFFHDSRMFRGGANFHVGSSQYCDHLIENNSDIMVIGEAFSLTCFVKK